MNDFKNLLIVGVGGGLSSSLANIFFNEGMNISLAARNIDKLDNLKKTIGATVFKSDSSNFDDVSNLFNELDKINKTPDFVIYNPSARVSGPVETLDPVSAKYAIDVTCFGGFLVAQQAIIRMKKKGFGNLFFTGATASIKGFANSSVFAMGKFGLRGLAQSLARELHPQNIHIAHFVIDGGISSGSSMFGGGDSSLHPDEIAKRYLEFSKQGRSAWSWEVELRPWVERF